VSIERKILRTLVEDDKSMLLRRVGTHLELVLGNVVLLSSAALETELQFGRLASEAPRGRVLVGGLGFGATLRGALETHATEVVVSEKLNAVIDVARNEAKELVGGALDDPRARIERSDVIDLILNAPQRSFSAILLDVDNGPEWASFRTNARLYADATLVAMRNVLMPGGIVAVWSGYPADSFLKNLRSAGFSPRIEPLREGQTVRARAYIGRVLPG
jgi:spermidine synthase